MFSTEMIPEWSFYLEKITIVILWKIRYISKWFLTSAGLGGPVMKAKGIERSHEYEDRY